MSSNGMPTQQCGVKRTLGDISPSVCAEQANTFKRIRSSSEIQLDQVPKMSLGFILNTAAAEDDQVAAVRQIRSPSRADYRLPYAKSGLEPRKQAQPSFSSCSGYAAWRVRDASDANAQSIEETSSEVSTEGSPVRGGESSAAGDAIRCDLCNKTFKERGNMTKHKRSVHSSTPRQFVCKVSGCHKSFAFRDGLNRHTSTVHENVRAHKCPVEGCDKRFKQRSHCEKHLRTVHRGAMQYPR